MNMHKSVKDLKVFLEPYHALIGMFIFVIGAIIGLYKFIVRPPDLALRIDKKEINFPNKVNTNFQNVFKFIADSTKNKKVLNDALNVYEYMINTTSFWTLTLKNQTDKTIHNIRVRVTNVSALNSFGVSGTFLLDQESRKLMNSILFEETSGIIHIEKIDEVPANGELTLYLWGKMSNLEFDQTVFASYDGGDARLEKHLEVVGFKAYLADYIYEIFFITILIFIAVYRFIIKKYSGVTH